MLESLIMAVLWCKQTKVKRFKLWHFWTKPTYKLYYCIFSYIPKHLGLLLYLWPYPLVWAIFICHRYFWWSSPPFWPVYSEHILKLNVLIFKTILFPCFDQRTHCMISSVYAVVILQSAPSKFPFAPVTSIKALLLFMTIENFF